MRLFTCSKCGNAIYFENVRCVNCGYTLAYFPEHGLVTSIRPMRTWRRKPADAPLYKALIKEIKGKYRLCANSAAGVCNSAVSADDPEELCHDCRLNDVVPDLTSPEALEAWQSLERWKRRLLFSLRQLQLPIESRAERPKNGLMFSFMRDSPDGKQKVFTGHCDGLITINIAEADDPFREKLRKQMARELSHRAGSFPSRDRTLLLGPFGAKTRRGHRPVAGSSATNGSTTLKPSSVTTRKARPATGPNAS